MKNLLTIILSMLAYVNIQSQDCEIQLPADTFLCDFKLTIQATPAGGIWNYNCENDYGKVQIEVENDSTFIFTFGACGIFNLEYLFDDGNCQEIESINIYVDDPSSSHTSLNNGNSLDYNDYGCHSGGSSGCGNSVSINGQSVPNPIWGICSNYSCNANILIPQITEFSNDSCFAQSIDITSIISNMDTSDCWAGGQESFIVVNTETGEVISNDFFEFLDSLNQELLIEFDGSCPIASGGCFSPDENCLDSITYDTTDLLFPVHLGGQWAILLSGDTILLEDTTSINLSGTEYLLIIEPGPDYYGPDEILFYLWELSGNDTVQPYFPVYLQVQWVENWTYDTLEWVDANYYYSDSLGCQSCGGNSFASTFNIPGIPDYDCGPVGLNFEGICPCLNININISGESIINCVNDCVELYASGYSDEGTFDINWFLPDGSYQNGNSIITCQGGLYQAEIISFPSGCTEYETFYVIEDFEEPLVDLPANYEISCINPCAILTPNIFSFGTFSFIWTGPNGFTSNEEFPSVCLAGQYILTVINEQNGCIINHSTTVIEVLEVVEKELSPTICEGETFSYNGSDFNSTGNYSLLIEMDDVCDTLISIDLVVEVPLSIIISEELCEGDAYNFLGNEYISSGIYNVTIPSNSACDTNVELQLEFIQPEFFFYEEIICEGEEIIIEGITFSNPGNYQFEIPSNSSCNDVVELSLEVVHDDITLSGISQINCENNTSIVTASTFNESVIWEWRSAQGELISSTETAAIDKLGDYSVYMISQLTNSCIFSSNFEITGSFEEAELEAPSVQNINCTDIILNAQIVNNGSFFFEWTGPNLNPSEVNKLNPFVSEVGTYTLTAISEESGCSSEIKIVVEAIQEMEITYETASTCPFENSGSLKINSIEGGVPPILFSYENSEWEEKLEFTNLSSGINLLNVQQGDGCESTYEIFIEEVDALILNLENQYELCGAEFIDINVLQSEDAGLVSYQWSDGSNESQRTINKAGEYSISISNDCQTITKNISITDSRLGDDLPIYVPNIFSPNGDGVNDELVCFGEIPIDNFEFTVYDRWGNLLFVSKDKENGWDGFFKGQLAPSNSYVWVMEADILDCDDTNKKISKHGSVALIR